MNSDGPGTSKPNATTTRAAPVRPRPQRPIVLVDDEPQILRSYEVTLRLGGYDNLRTCADSTRAMDLLAEEGAELLLLDLVMPALRGEELLPRVARRYPELPVVVITGTDEVESAVSCMKAGAADYLVKPVSRERLLATVGQCLRTRELQRENRRLAEGLKRDDLRHPEHFAEMVTNDPGMRALFRYVEAVAGSSQPVLITGETGVGKELLARAVHRASGRPGELVTVNIAGLEPQLLDDALFGHVRGAFTGADRARAGLVERARGGTLFLDEVGDLSSTAQVKLLRLLQEGEYYPLGTDRPRRVELRIVAATHRDLQQMQAEDRFRADLFYRLQGHQVALPPLRRRSGDLPLLVTAFVEQAAAELDREVHPPGPEALALLGCHPFPGNVRELRSLVFDALGLHPTLDQALDYLRQRLGRDAEAAHGEEPPCAGPEANLVVGARMPTIEQAKDLLIAEALHRTGNNKSNAARLLGITRQALNKRLRRS